MQACIVLPGRGFMGETRPEQRDDNTEITNCDRINTRQLEMARHVQNKYIWANTKLQSRAVVDSILPGTQPAQRLSAS